jgi:phage tail protein X
MRRIVAKSGDTFSKIAYRYFQNSSRYKDILDVNPGYTSVDLPVPGDYINIPDSSENSSLGTLTGGSLVSQIGTDTQDTESFYYPWNTRVEMMLRCLDYAPATLEYPRRTNGYTLDSYEAENGKEVSTSVFLTQQLLKRA